MLKMTGKTPEVRSDKRKPKKALKTAKKKMIDDLKNVFAYLLFENCQS